MQKFLTNKKFLAVLFVLFILLILALGFRPRLPAIGPQLTPTPTPPQKKMVSNPQGLGFDSLILESKPTLVASASENFPGGLSTYEINPAPYQLFSPQAAQTIAGKFGFTANAKVSSSGNLYIYREKDKTLTLDHQIGTVSFTTDLSKLANTGSLTASQATQKIKEFLQATSLNSQFIDWEGGVVKSMGWTQGGPKETALAQELKFYQALPKISVNQLALVLPQSIFAQVALNGEVVGLYTWFINLDGENPQVKNLKSLEQAKKEVQAGEGIVFSTAENSQKINLNQVDLAYFAPPEFFVNFTTRHFLKIVYVFYDDKGSQVYINAVKE